MKTHSLFCVIAAMISFSAVGCGDMPTSVSEEHDSEDAMDLSPSAKRVPRPKRAWLAVSVLPEPVPQKVVAGTKDFPFANYLLDARAAKKDIAISLLKVRFTGTDRTTDQLLNCRLFDGATSLTTGVNVVNPDDGVLTGDDLAFNLDCKLVVPKGTVKTITLKCDLKSRLDPEATSGVTTFAFGISNRHGVVEAAEAVSGRRIDVSITWTWGQAMTIVAAGGLAIARDGTNPMLRFVAAGAADEVLSVLIVSGFYEAILLDTIHLQLDGTGATSALRKVTLWIGDKQIGEAVFTSRRYATSTFTTIFGATTNDYTVPKNGQLLITVKGDIGTIGIFGEAASGDLVAVNYDADPVAYLADRYNTGGLRGIGLVSGNVTYSGASAGDTDTPGIRIVKAIPEVQRVPLVNTIIVNASRQMLYRFKISAPAGTNGIGLYRFTFNIDPSDIGGIRIDDFEVYCYTDAGFSIPSGGDPSGLLNGIGIPVGVGGMVDNNTATGSIRPQIYFNPTNPTGATPEAVYVPAGETRYFALRAGVSSIGRNTIAVTLMGDSEFITPASAEEVDGSTSGRFIWTDNPVSTAASIISPSWLSGFLIPGFSADGLAPEILTIQ